MSELQKDCLEIEAKLPIRFYFETQNSLKDPVLIFLHGYTDSASSFLRSAYDKSKLAFDVLAPNGPFPIPVASDKGYKEAYSWYFEDHSMGRIIISKDVAVEILVQLIHQLKIEDRPKILVGFSQGGFLAPKLAEKLTKIQKIIGIGCDYREDLYQNIKGIPIFGIHGEEDRIVDYQRARTNYLARQFKGEFASIKNMGHKMTEESKAKLTEYILF